MNLRAEMCRAARDRAAVSIPPEQTAGCHMAVSAEMCSSVRLTTAAPLARVRLEQGSPSPVEAGSWVGKRS